MKSGSQTSYVVDELKIVEPSDTAVLLQRGKPSVILVTCYPFDFVGSAPHRFIAHSSYKQHNPVDTSQIAPQHPGDKSEKNQETSQ
jgi:sortase A